MSYFYIRLSTWGTTTPHIVDEEAIYQAERGMNYLNPDEYDFLCEAESMHDAEKFYDEELSRYYFDQMTEVGHP